MIELSLKVDQFATEAVLAAIDARVIRLGKSYREATTAAAINVLKSLRARTTANRTNRLPVRPAFGKKSLYKDGRRMFLVERFDRKTDAKKFHAIWATSSAEAKQSPLALLRYWKLAKQSWGWTMKKLSDKGAGEVNSRNAQVAQRNVAVTQEGGENALKITIENRLDYIGKAFGGADAGAVLGDSMRAASRKMMGDIERRLK